MTDIEDIVPKNIKLNPKLKHIVQDYCQQVFTSHQQFEKYRLTAQRKYKISYTKFDLMQTYHHMLETNEIEENNNFVKYCTIKSVRHNHGVIVFTVVLAPASEGVGKSCKNDCAYCPQEPNVARSYMVKEPAVARAFENNWDPVKQIYARAKQYINNGIMARSLEELKQKNLDGYKIDVIIEGGTYNDYLKSYRMNFIHSLFYACNTFYDTEKRQMLSLEEEKLLNQTSYIKIIGMSAETRPDNVNTEILKEFRTLGITRVQVGIQHLNDDILRKINRGCYTKHTVRGLKLLKDNGFKVAVHYMPDLPYSSMETDLAMWQELFSNPDLEFDYCKLYPCMTMPYTKLIDMIANGEYKPYANEMITVEGFDKQIPKIVVVCADFLIRCKQHHRVERVLRDLPIEQLLDGCGITNLRQFVEQYAAKQGKKIVEIRHREVRNQQVDYDEAVLNYYSYKSSGGLEYFISFESPEQDLNEFKSEKKYIYGFLRLRIPDQEVFGSKTKLIEELKQATLIREIHVYGMAVAVGTGFNTNQKDESAQHRGFGTKMLELAEELSKKHGYNKTAVIAGEGVKQFYAKRGFTDGEYYMFKQF